MPAPAATRTSATSAPPRGRLRDQHVRIGAVWVSLMEPDTGYEVAFNEWYADDHFYDGGMSVPWIFGGRRWVCPRDHQALRVSQSNTTFRPPEAGRFLHLNFFSAGHVEDVGSALGDVIAGLAGEGRMYVDDIPRRHVYSRIQPYVGAIYANPEDDGPLDIHALDYPFGGVVVEVVRARAGRSRDELVAWLQEEFVPDRLTATKADMCLISLDADLPETLSSKTKRIPRAYGEGAEERVTLLWFTEDDPSNGWHVRFAGHTTQFEQAGLGIIEFASAFVPTVPGTNRLIDTV